MTCRVWTPPAAPPRPAPRESPGIPGIPGLPCPPRLGGISEKVRIRFCVWGSQRVAPSIVLVRAMAAMPPPPSPPRLPPFDAPAPDASEPPPPPGHVQMRVREENAGDGARARGKPDGRATTAASNMSGGSVSVAVRPDDAEWRDNQIMRRVQATLAPGGWSAKGFGTTRAQPRNRPTGTRSGALTLTATNQQTRSGATNRRPRQGATA